MFDEKKHPRDNKGRFTFKDYVGMDIKELKSITQKEYRQNTKYEQIVYPTIYKKIDDLDEEEMTEQERAKDKFFGVEYVGYKGAEAIEKLLKEKKGHIKAAFHRPEIGDITLVWGDENGGLLHAIIERDKMKADGIGTISGLEIAKKIPEIIRYGIKVEDTQRRLNLEYKGLRVGIKQNYDNDQVNWIVSAMEIIPGFISKKKK